MTQAETIRDDGGPAFAGRGSAEFQRDHSGMSLRDYFAARAIEEASRAAVTVKEADIDRLFGTSRTNILRAEIVAAIAYELADAMLEARK